MYPFIHIGPLTLGSYGLMVATGLICAFFILRADFARRGIAADAEAIIGITGLSGLAGSRLYHLLESPANFSPIRGRSYSAPWDLRLWAPSSADSWPLCFWPGVSGSSPLLMLDVASPAAALGYGIGRIGCLISGDGDYGMPTTLPWGMAFPHGIVPTTESCVEWGAAPDCRVHPTPIYEFLIAVLIFWILWRLGERALKRRAPNGIIFAAYLVLTGIARFLVEIIRINPRSFFGMSNAQAASVVSILAGVALFFYCRARQASRAR